jgi:hypothetical protein
VNGTDASRSWLDRAGRAVSRIPFTYLALILFSVFVATRMSYFWFDPRVDLSLDSKSYLELAREFGSGKWPQLLWRTPGYPLFILLVTIFDDRWLAIVLVQNVLSFLSSLALVYSIYRLRRPLAFPAAIAMCGFLGSSHVLIYDISILSESLYTSLICFLIAGLFLGFALNRAVFFGLASFAMGWAILDRPAAGYFVVIYALVITCLLWNHCRPAVTAAFGAPFPLLILSLCAYNYATAGKFTATGFAEANLAGATLLFWEPDPRLPPEVNQALETLPQAYRRIGLTDGELAMERSSWDVGPLFELYAKAYNRLVWSSGFGTGWRFSGHDYMHNRTLVRDAALVAIRRHPNLYAKFVWVNLVEFFGDIGFKYDFNASIAYRFSGPTPQQVKVADLTKTDDSRPAAEASPPSAPQGGISSGDRSAFESAIRKVQTSWQTLHGILFQNVVWCFAYLAVAVASLVQLARFAGRHLGAFLLVVITLIPIGASLVVCMFEVALDRYSYPTQFIEYLSVALLPLLWFRGDFRASVGRSGAREKKADSG